MASYYSHRSSSLLVMISLAFLSSSTLVVYAREFKVGGDSGWLEPAPTNATFYNQWAVAHRFRVGDSLVFEYGNDTVLAVDKWGYYHCDTSRPIESFDGGNSKVRLDRPDLFYFISGSVDCCKRGLRMIVDVMAPRAPPSSPAPSPAHSSGPELVPAAAAAHVFLLATALVVLFF